MVYLLVPGMLEVIIAVLLATWQGTLTDSLTKMLQEDVVNNWEAGKTMTS